MSVWALLPLKALDKAKQRLADTLSPEQRRELMLAMARDVLTALKQSQRLAGVLIISRTSEARALAESFSTEIFAEDEHADLAGALTEGAAHAASRCGASGVMVTPADLPLLTAAEIDRLLEQHRQVTIVPDAEHVGTNALVCSPPNCLPFVFDGRSFKPHLLAAQERNLDPAVYSSPGFALDIDTPADLNQLLARNPGCQTGTYLDKSGIAQALRGQDNDPFAAEGPDDDRGSDH